MIRAATTQDVDELLRLEHACFEHDLLKRSDFRNALRATKSLLLVKDDGGKLAAYALLRMQGRKGHLLSLAVDPEARRRGLGRALIGAVEEAALARGARHMQLELREDNGAAEALYASLGYRHHGTWLAYYEDESDAHCMQKILTGEPPPEPHNHVGFEIR
ncbi:MAG TPA: ribosomal protein S18-alanine N-acetyltransferase [Gammaproteobacteria bacterium]|jgi:ribosomal-protein-alanine acetyltransferase|nr:ribosomal protein S18-alanine N-acetyltransferase [Gammaproteobacteria bacterium]